MEANGLNAINKIESNASIIEGRDESTQKLKRRRKLRRLYQLQKADNEVQHGLLYTSKYRWSWIGILTLISFVTAVVLMQYYGYSASVVFSNLVSIYTNHYMAILHNKVNYCEPNTDLQSMFQHVRELVLHQEQALSQLEIAMRNESEFQAMALVGSSGVGKSLTARLLREHYPWPENTVTYSWNAHVHDDMFKYKNVRNLLANMPHCGRTLLIVDNLTPCDYEFVSVINKLMLNKEASNKHSITVAGERKYVSIIYIFNLNKMLPYYEYMKQYQALQQLPDTTVINYREFGKNELKDCIHNELKLENMTISNKFLDEIMDNTDVEESGCKTVRSKVLIYGDVPQNASV